MLGGESIKHPSNENDKQTLSLFEALMMKRAASRLDPPPVLTASKSIKKDFAEDMWGTLSNDAKTICKIRL
jgi:hypothetical protein